MFRSCLVFGALFTVAIVIKLLSFMLFKLNSRRKARPMTAAGDHEHDKFETGPRPPKPKPRTPSSKPLPPGNWDPSTKVLVPGWSVDDILDPVPSAALSKLDLRGVPGPQSPTASLSESSHGISPVGGGSFTERLGAISEAISKESQITKADRPLSPAKGNPSKGSPAKGSPARAASTSEAAPASSVIPRRPSRNYALTRASIVARQNSDAKTKPSDSPESAGKPKADTNGYNAQIAALKTSPTNLKRPSSLRTSIGGASSGIKRSKAQEPNGASKSG
ncbi:hypothetical protein CYMTET_15931 [Cymbomonas tetramitiformis]|uniref:Uncharacterized protein n=1 Tax=Cymbomonas tetramitiformis TaxID=36881 RepID=A0AAE0L8P1_9CHLO|nr:hypothetical protein CYMTET_15931 [Cymbomonas tetramitiformis]